MASTLQTIRAILMIVAGVSAIIWFLYELIYRIVKRKEEGGFLYVEMPTWHKVLFWPICLSIIGLGLWAFLE
jgi:hypothetical protein